MENENINNELNEIKQEIAKREVQKEPATFFKKEEPKLEVAEKKDEKNELIEQMFKDGIKYQITTDKSLQDTVLSTAKTYTETKMQTIITDVDTEHKEAIFNNKKDACESYGFNEKTTPIWATKFMSGGYSIMLAIWLFIGSFTFMPVIFVAKKLAVGIKNTWIAGLIAILLYLGITFVPLLIALLK